MTFAELVEVASLKSEDHRRVRLCDAGVFKGGVSLRLIQRLLEAGQPNLRILGAWLLTEIPNDSVSLKTKKVSKLRQVIIDGGSSLFVSRAIRSLGTYSLPKNDSLILGPIDIHFNQMSEAAR